MKTIFLIDDNTTNLITAKNLLSKYYTIYTLPSAEKMFKFLEKINPELILLDVFMPVMDGFEALSILKSNEKYKNIPVIFLTGKEDEESEKRGIEMGAIDFIKKPFSPPDLIKRIEMHLTTEKDNEPA
ncbi:MAG: response regulator [Treponema sp.]|nr:response regulator [Treponema sp.]MCL2252431.1 response regulator [Treponema sp.]